MTWSDEQVGLLKQLHATGASYSDMGSELGVGRNAIAGKLHRLGLTDDRPDRKPRTAPRRQKAKPEERFLRMTQKKELPPPAAEPEVHDTRKTIHELTSETCRWPLGDDMDPAKLFYCGKRPLDGRSYCVEHARRAYHAAPYLRSATLARIA